jgi:hypothetical protein
MITGNEHDELIFDFLEGNLTAEEEGAFRMLKDESELIDRQVRLWENTFLKEPMPSVEALEQKLLLQPGIQTGGWLGRIYAWLPILFLYITFAGDFAPETETNAPNGLKTNETTSSTTACLSEPVLVSEEPVKPKLPHPPQKVATSQFENTKSLTMTVAVSDLKRSTIITPLISVRRIEPIDLRLKTHRSFLVKKKWSKREMRFIRKRLWQIDNTRQLNEFRRGRVPYVVPLSNNNF